MHPIATKALPKEINIDGMMRPAHSHFYLLCVLPDLNGLGSKPPVDRKELSSLVFESGGPTDIVQTLLLSDDLHQREAVLAGETDPGDADMSVLSLEQAKAEAPLPDFLIPEREEESDSAIRAIAVDPIWQNYFQYASGVARIASSQFLQAWVGFEVGIRNALAKARARALELDPGPYVVAEALGDPESSFENVLGDWMAASNPLEALEILDRARWDWVAEHERWYSFSDDEVAAYAVKLMLLHRWQRISAGHNKEKHSQTSS
jgi:hypothetical protein